MRPRLSEEAVSYYKTPAEVREMVRSSKPALSILSSETSNEAARKIEPVRGHLQVLVYNVIRATTERGCTDEEGIAASELPASTYRPRRVELVEANRVRDSGTTRPGKSGRRMTVWVAE